MRPGDVIATGGTRAVRIDGGQERRWMDDGTRLFLGAFADLGDDDLDRPLALPGWTGRPGAENRMYASPGQRASEIEAGAARPAAEPRGDFTAALLADTWLERERAIWEEAVTIDPGDDPALVSFHGEGVRSLEHFALIRRVLAVATAP